MLKFPENFFDRWKFLPGIPPLPMLRLFYPYNEHLPCHKAHDVFVVHECASLAQQGHAVTLLAGHRSAPISSLETHYGVALPPTFHFHPLFLLRKNTAHLPISWNLPFFYHVQRQLQHTPPDWVLLSVRKQGSYHLRRKIPGVRYLYEVHELLRYPNLELPGWEEEREMLSQADSITVTTAPLKDILSSPPYSLSVPIHVVPLAVAAHSLPPPPPPSPFVFIYVGQLYAGQGVSLLLEAFSLLKEGILQIVGGKPEEIAHLQQEVKRRRLEKRVALLGYHPPHALPALVSAAHVCVAPFENQGRMPYVAHTKLYEYAHWGRPIVAPACPTVRTAFSQGGVALFRPGDPAALAEACQALSDPKTYHRLTEEMQAYRGAFSWEKRAITYGTLLARG